LAIKVRLQFGSTNIDENQRFTNLCTNRPRPLYYPIAECPGICGFFSVEAVNLPFARAVAGLDDYGNYTIAFINPFCEDPLVCYDTFYINGTNVISMTPPKLWADPNPIAGDDPCAVNTPGIVGYQLICNNGHTLIEGEYDRPDGSIVFGLWSGSSPDLVNDLVLSGFFQGGQMTPNGNAFVVNTQSDTIFVLVDLDTKPVPEPNSLILLGTGALSLFGVARRKMFARL
jgi:hypothetical protein